MVVSAALYTVVLTNGKEDDYIMAKGYKGEAIKAARDLGYGIEVVEKIRRAKTETEVIQIMCAARCRD